MDEPIRYPVQFQSDKMKDYDMVIAVNEEEHRPLLEDWLGEELNEIIFGLSKTVINGR